MRTFNELEAAELEGSKELAVKTDLALEISRLVDLAKGHYTRIREDQEAVNILNAEMYQKLVRFVIELIETNTSLTSEEHFYGGYSILWSSDNGSSTNLWVYFKSNVKNDLKTQLFEYAQNSLGNTISEVLSAKVLKLNTHDYGISFELQYPESIKR